MTEGRKDDIGKLRYDLVPPDALREVAKVYTFGAMKYGDRNWEQGINYGRVYAAAQRHLQAWLGGEQDDAESGLPHMAHAAWNCLALLAYELRGMGEFDDRKPRVRQDPEVLRKFMSGELDPRAIPIPMKGVSILGEK